jgi:hypothetical protein
MGRFLMQSAPGVDEWVLWSTGSDTGLPSSDMPKIGGEALRLAPRHSMRGTGARNEVSSPEGNQLRRASRTCDSMAAVAAPPACTPGFSRRAISTSSGRV